MPKKLKSPIPFAPRPSRERRSLPTRGRTARVPSTLLARLERLDPEQLQIVEIVVVAIARGSA
jgi:hypothetical protein